MGHLGWVAIVQSRRCEITARATVLASSCAAGGQTNERERIGTASSRPAPNRSCTANAKRPYPSTYLSIYLSVCLSLYRVHPCGCRQR
jgi:hypothetical protein